MRDIRVFAEKLAQLFYPQVEVSLWSWPEKREEGCWQRLTAEVERPQGEEGVRTLVIGKGKVVKQLLHFVRDTEGKAYAALVLRWDLEPWSLLQKQLEALFPAQNEAQHPPWQNLVDGEISAFLAKEGCALDGMNRQQRRALVHFLHEKGMFGYKEASKYIAQLLGISRATVYNYLQWATSLQTLCVHQVDTFTSTQFAGNPAGVVLEADSLSDETMRKVAREMNLSETAFVSKSSLAAIRLRYFTPSGHEVNFCGHSTVGALYTMAYEEKGGMKGAGSYPFLVETRAGVLSMQVQIDENEKISVEYDAPEVLLTEPPCSHEEVERVLGLPQDLIEKSLPLAWEETNADLILPVRSLSALQNLDLDQKAAQRFCEKYHIVALCFVSTETVDTTLDLHLRCFAPAVGIPEDPFTGSVLGGLAVYARQQGLIAAAQKTLYAEQGHEVGRPGRVRVDLKEEDGKCRARIHAEAVHCFSTKIHMNS